eukprot:CAMPEP_0183584604 /NCGR_PEP_ID=MMETSP0371-20130417/153772_1 /TAXON_ID=268820 /ORGANISM="Peridinium aciculiferum, Strain PAER-2" /LENGTH=97 /DNA_ID=CAMNT_0025795523 /DNA_START=44 /DNA_END=337 /DNA_ORIENTATION=+
MIGTFGLLRARANLLGRSEAGDQNNACQLKREARAVQGDLDRSRDLSEDKEGQQTGDHDGARGVQRVAHRVPQVLDAGNHQQEAGGPNAAADVRRTN